MGRPSVSVLMAVYNGERFLEEAIDSVVSQTYYDFEFIIINDGSTDRTSSILGSFGDRRIKVIDQDRMGLTKSLNKAIDRAQGQYIARMDADDVSLPSRLARQAEILDARPDVVLVASLYDRMNAQSHKLRTVKVPLDDAYRLWRLQFHNTYCHGSVMVRKEALVKVGKYDEKFTYAQDYDLWVRLCNRFNTYVIPDVLFRQRVPVDGQQISGRHLTEQTHNAALISTNALVLCNPTLTEPQCAEMRSLYWKLQGDTFSPEALRAVFPTFEGFCRRYGISQKEKTVLERKIIADALNVIGESPNPSRLQRTRMAAQILKRHPLSGSYSLLRARGKSIRSILRVR